VILDKRREVAEQVIALLADSDPAILVLIARRSGVPIHRLDAYLYEGAAIAFADLLSIEQALLTMAKPEC
jgi:hypothetical protein